MKTSFFNLNRLFSLGIILWAAISLSGCKKQPAMINQAVNNLMTQAINIVTPNTTLAETSTAGEIDLKPPAEGIYLLNDGGLVPVPGLETDTTLDLKTLPHTSDASPVFSIMGENYPLGYLHIDPYIAGIGVDFSYSDSVEALSIRYTITHPLRRRD